MAAPALLLAAGVFGVFGGGGGGGDTAALSVTTRSSAFAPSTLRATVNPVGLMTLSPALLRLVVAEMAFTNVAVWPTVKPVAETVKLPLSVTAVALMVGACVGVTWKTSVEPVACMKVETPVIIAVDDIVAVPPIGMFTVAVPVAPSLRTPFSVPPVKLKVSPMFRERFTAPLSAPAC